SCPRSSRPRRWRSDTCRRRRGLPAAAPQFCRKSRSNPFLPRCVSGWGRDFRAGPGARSWEVFMRTIATHLSTTGLVLLAALAVTPAGAADLDVSSAVDAVTVYPDGASVTRIITFDLPAGDNTLVAKDFPLTLDPSSLRV